MLIRAALATVLTIGAAASIASAEPREPAAQAASQASDTIFYSGKGTAGAGSGRAAGAYTMVHSKGARIFDGAETWKGTSDCNSNRAVPRRTGRSFTRLVGYSVGRLGPAYYLQQYEQRKQTSAVRSIVVLDPGVGDEFGCDRKSGAGYTYATWLRQNAVNRLLIVTAASSAVDGYAGLNEVYASKLGGELAQRVLICDAPKVKHDQVDDKFRWLIGGATQTSCPAGTSPNRYSPKAPAVTPPSGGPTPNPPPPGEARRVVAVDNRVTNAMGMREDPTPARLNTMPWVRCSSRGCAIGGTERGSGGTYDAAVCQTSGERTTNGNDSSAADDSNPERFESTRYYGVRLGDGTFGYISEVWIRASDRGGLGLPSC